VDVWDRFLERVAPMVESDVSGLDRLDGVGAARLVGAAGPERPAYAARLERGGVRLLAQAGDQVDGRGDDHDAEKV
jgi:hypothetical protein